MKTLQITQLQHFFLELLASQIMHRYKLLFLFTNDRGKHIIQRPGDD